MNEYTKEMLTLLKNRYIQTVGEKTFCSDRESQMKAYWLEKYEDNLIYKMDANAKKAYGEGAGNEITSGKIGALKSSSALTYNLFWDQISELTHRNGTSRIGNGVYKVEFEKKLRTLKSSSIPSHMDAFLYCKHTKEAVACEMKMTEWIFNQPGQLREAYLNPKNYVDSEIGNVLVALAKELICYEDSCPENGKYSCRMKRYDAFQMFKHVSACYTACKEKDPGKIKKITLVNCIWTLQNPRMLSEKSYEKYMAEEDMERKEFEGFRQSIEPVKEVFKSMHGVDFDVCFYTFADFLALFEKTAEELAYLERYKI